MKKALSITAIFCFIPLLIISSEGGRSATIDTAKFFAAKRPAARTPTGAESRASSESVLSDEKLLDNAKTFFSLDTHDTKHSTRTKNRLIDLIDITLGDKSIRGETREAARALLSTVLAKHPEYVDLVRPSRSINERVQRFLIGWEKLSIA